MKRYGKVGFLMVSLLVLMQGCAVPALPHTNSNGDSGTVLSTGSKLLAGNIGELNSAEWQVFATDLADLIISIPALADILPPDLEVPELTDAQAEALEHFLADNNVMTFSDLTLLAERISAGEVAIPDILFSLWGDLVQQFA